LFRLVSSVTHTVSIVYKIELNYMVAIELNYMVAMVAIELN